MIEIHEVSKFYGSVAALRDVSLSVAPGELVLLLGANGAGKSTLVRSVLGILPYHGEIRVAGMDPLVDGKRVRGRIGYMAQGGGLHGDLTVAETIDFYSALRGVDGARGHELLAGVGLSGALEARVAELSGGMLQRLSFALACLSDPPVLLLDEPTASLDAASRLAVGERLRRLADDGKAILLSTHVETQLEGFADRAVTLEAGRIVDVRRPAPAGLRVAPSPRSGGVGYPPGKARGAPAPRPAGPGRARPPSAVLQLARKGMRDALHDRWLITYALLLGVLGVVAALLGLRSSAGMGLQMFGRTTATLTNLCLMLAPLVGLSMGAAAIAGERDRGTMETLLAQPLERRDLLLGKYLGLLLALAAATVVGFLPAAFVVARYAGAASLLGYVLFPLLSIFLIGAMLGLGLLISVRSHGGVQAQGRAIFCWFLFVLMYDLLLMGTLVTSGLSSTALSLLLVANPVDAARVLVVLALEPDLYLLGPAGALLVAELSRTGTAALLVTSLLVWAVVPVGLALLSFRLRRQRSLPAGRTVVIAEIEADAGGAPAASEHSHTPANRGRCLELGLPPVEKMEVS
jgi:ABC-type multidrug transport system ATPase subunit/ABC-type transport system involved in multi-copper enzyme maturation permease subunit